MLQRITTTAYNECRAGSTQASIADVKSISARVVTELRQPGNNQIQMMKVFLIGNCNSLRYRMANFPLKCLNYTHFRCTYIDVI